MAWTNLNGGAAVFYTSDADKLNNKLGYRILEGLPTATFTNDFSSDVGFVAAQRCTAKIYADSSSSFGEIVTASNAGNKYAYAYYDLSEVLADNTTSAIIEFDAFIPSGSRAKISLVDLSKRVDSDGNIAPGTSSKDSYDRTGIAFMFGEYNSNYAVLQDTKQSFSFDVWLHFKFVINVSERSIEYTISEGDTVWFTGTSKFFNDEASKVNGIELYTYQNNAVIDFDNLDISANYDVDEGVLYIVKGEDGCKLYMYEDAVAIEVSNS